MNVIARDMGRQDTLQIDQGIQVLQPAFNTGSIGG